MNNLSKVKVYEGIPDEEFVTLLKEQKGYGVFWNYKGYQAEVRYSKEDHCFYGRLHGISDLITFEADSIDKLEPEFYTAVDDYLIVCEEVGKKPDMPM